MIWFKRPDVNGLEKSNNIKDLIKALRNVGSARVQVTQPRQPCFKLAIGLGDSGAARKSVQAEKPGAYVRVLDQGTVRTDDESLTELRDQDNFTVRVVFHFLYNGRGNLEAVGKAIEMPELANACRDDLIKLLER